MLSDLDIEFKEAFEKISSLKQEIPPDTKLKFYAFYKQANYGNNFSYNNEDNLISGFKFNAWMQLKGMTVEQAKKEYIKLANKILNNKT